MANKIVGRQGIKGALDKVSLAPFAPSATQKQIKIRYYNRAKFQGSVDPDKASLDEIASLAGMDPHQLAEWVGQAGFENWFRDRMSTADKIDYYFEEALNNAAYLASSAEKQSDQLAAMRFLADVKREKDKRQAAEDEETPVSPEQLIKLIEKLGYVKKELPSGQERD